MNRLERYIARQLRDSKMRDLIEKEIAALEVGVQIARLRGALKMNQTQLAARAGMNASKVSKIESAPKNVTLNTLTRLAIALNRRIKIDFVAARKRKATAGGKRHDGVAHKRRSALVR